MRREIYHTIVLGHQVQTAYYNHNSKAIKTFIKAFCFLPHDAILARYMRSLLSMCPSVCLFDTSWYSIKTAKYRITQTKLDKGKAL